MNITYYISNSGDDTYKGTSQETPFKTLAPIKAMAGSQTLHGSDTILFKRGDTFEGFTFEWNTGYYTENIQIGAYGYGNKPVFDMYKYINDSSWIEHASGVWKVNLSNTDNFTGWTSNNSGNVGFLKINEEIHGIKKRYLNQLANQWDFYDDSEDSGYTLYVKSNINPGLINISEKGIAVSVKGTSTLRLHQFADFYNLTIIGHGGHGASASQCNSLSYNDIDFIDIGGATLTGFNFWVRYGNGIEFNGWGKNAIVQGCYFENIYDVAMTCQGQDSGTEGFENFIFRYNRTKQAEQAIEFYVHSEVSFFRNIKVHDNIFEESGLGPLHFGHQAYNSTYPQFLGVPILLQDSYVDMDDIEIFNNTIYLGANGLYFWLKTNPAAQKKFVNSHNNDIYLYEGQRLHSTMETWRVRDYLDFIQDTGLEKDSKFYEIPIDQTNIIEVLRSQVAKTDAQKSRAITVGSGNNFNVALAQEAFNKANKSDKRLNNLPIASDNLLVGTTLYGTVDQVTGWSKVAEVSVSLVNNRDFVVTLLFTCASADMQSAKVTFSGKAGNPTVTSPTTMSIDVESISGYARNQFFTEDGFKITNDGYGTPFNIYIKRSNNFSGVKVYELVKHNPTGTFKYYTNSIWLNDEPSGLHNYKSQIKSKPILQSEAVSTATVNSVVRRGALGGIVNATILMTNALFPGGVNDLRTSNLVYQSDPAISFTGEPSLNFNGMYYYMGDNNKGLQVAVDSLGIFEYHRVYWFGTWRNWMKVVYSNYIQEDSVAVVAPTLAQLNALPATTTEINYTNNAVLANYKRVSAGGWIKTPITKVV